MLGGSSEELRKSESPCEKGMNGSECQGNCCAVPVNSSVCQNLDEMEFERGIWQAALDNDVQRIQHLISYQRTDPDKLDSYGYTALHYAARNGKIESVKCLLNHGANINFRTRNNGATPLQRAVTANKLEMVKYLLSCGADPTIEDLDGLNAMDRATRDKRDEIVELLKQHSSSSSSPV